MSRVGTFFRNTGNRFVEYCKTLATDYGTVAKETVTGCKEKPVRAAGYFSILGGLVYLYKTNPSEEEMMNELREKRQMMVLVPNSSHSKKADRELAVRSLLLAQNRLHYYNLWFFSLLIRSTEDDKARIYWTQTQNLKDWPWMEVYNNILDIGALGRWWKLHENFEDYDVNSEEMDLLPA